MPHDAYDKIYSITLGTEEGDDYLDAFLDEPLPEGTTVNITFDLEAKVCSFDFTDPDGLGSPEGYSDDWEGCLDWLEQNGHAREAAEIRNLAAAESE